MLVMAGSQAAKPVAPEQQRTQPPPPIRNTGGKGVSSFGGSKSGAPDQQMRQQGKITGSGPDNNQHNSQGPQPQPGNGPGPQPPSNVTSGASTSGPGANQVRSSEPLPSTSQSQSITQTGGGQQSGGLIQSSPANFTPQTTNATGAALGGRPPYRRQATSPRCRPSRRTRRATCTTTSMTCSSVWINRRPSAAHDSARATRWRQPTSVSREGALPTASTIADLRGAEGWEWGPVARQGRRRAEQLDLPLRHRRLPRPWRHLLQIRLLVAAQRLQPVPTRRRRLPVVRRVLAPDQPLLHFHSASVPMPPIRVLLAD